MPLIPEPPTPTKWIRWIFLNTSRLEQVGDAGGGVGTAEGPRRVFHRFEAAGRFQRLRHGARQHLAAQLLLLDHEGRPGGLEGARVAALVVVGDRKSTRLNSSHITI